MSYQPVPKQKEKSSRASTLHPNVQKMLNKNGSSFSIRKKLALFGIKQNYQQPALWFSSAIEEVFDLITLFLSGLLSNSEEAQSALIQLEKIFKQLGQEKAKVPTKLSELSFGNIMHMIDILGHQTSQQSKYLCYYLKRTWLLYIQHSDIYLDTILSQIEEFESYVKEIYIFLIDLCVLKPDTLDRVLKTVNQVIFQILGDQQNNYDLNQQQLSLQQQSQQEDFINFLLTILSKFESSTLEDQLISLLTRQKIPFQASLHSSIIDQFLSKEENIEKFFKLSLEFIKRGLEVDENQIATSYFNKVEILFRLNQNKEIPKSFMMLIEPILIAHNSLSQGISQGATEVLNMITSKKKIIGCQEEIFTNLSSRLTAGLSEDKCLQVEAAITELIDKYLSESELEKISKQKKCTILANISASIFSLTRNQNPNHRSRIFYQKIISKLNLTINLILQALCRLEWKVLSLVDIHGFSEFINQTYQIDVKNQFQINTSFKLFGTAGVFFLFLLNNKTISVDILDRFNMKSDEIKISKLNLNIIHGFLSSYSHLEESKIILTNHIPIYFKLDRLIDLKSLETLYTQKFIYSAIKDSKDDNVNVDGYQKAQISFTSISPPYIFRSNEEKRLLFVDTKVTELQNLEIQTVEGKQNKEISPSQKNQQIIKQDLDTSKIIDTTLIKGSSIPVLEQPIKNINRRQSSQLNPLNMKIQTNNPTTTQQQIEEEKNNLPPLNEIKINSNQQASSNKMEIEESIAINERLEEGELPEIQSKSTNSELPQKLTLKEITFQKMKNKKIESQRFSESQPQQTLLDHMPPFDQKIELTQKEQGIQQQINETNPNLIKLSQSSLPQNKVALQSQETISPKKAPSLTLPFQQPKQQNNKNLSFQKTQKILKSQCDQIEEHNKPCLPLKKASSIKIPLENSQNEQQIQQTKFDNEIKQISPEIQELKEKQSENSMEIEVGKQVNQLENFSFQELNVSGQMVPEQVKSRDGEEVEQQSETNAKNNDAVIDTTLELITNTRLLEQEQIEINSAQLYNFDETYEERLNQDTSIEKLIRNTENKINISNEQQNSQTDHNQKIEIDSQLLNLPLILPNQVKYYLLEEENKSSSDLKGGEGYLEANQTNSQKYEIKNCYQIENQGKDFKQILINESAAEKEIYNGTKEDIISSQMINEKQVQQQFQENTGINLSVEQLVTNLEESSEIKFEINQNNYDQNHVEEDQKESTENNGDQVENQDVEDKVEVFQKLEKFEDEQKVKQVIE